MTGSASATQCPDWRAADRAFRPPQEDPTLPPVPPRGASASPPAPRGPPSAADTGEGPIYQNRVSVIPSIGERTGAVGGPVTVR